MKLSTGFLLASLLTAPVNAHECGLQSSSRPPENQVAPIIREVISIIREKPGWNAAMAESPRIPAGNNFTVSYDAVQYLCAKDYTYDPRNVTLNLDGETKMIDRNLDGIPDAFKSYKSLHDLDRHPTEQEIKIFQKALRDAVRLNADKHGNGISQ